MNDLFLVNFEIGINSIEKVTCRNFWQSFENSRFETSVYGYLTAQKNKQYKLLNCSSLWLFIWDSVHSALKVATVKISWYWSLFVGDKQGVSVKFPDLLLVGEVIYSILW